MKRKSPTLRLTMRLTLCILSAVVLASCQPDGERVSFNAEVRPIFNAHCVGCHGGVMQSGELGLIFREDAMAAIAPGSARRSELIKRIRHSNPELRMPYQRAPLSEADIQTLERWDRPGCRMGGTLGLPSPYRNNSTRQHAGRRQPDRCLRHGSTCCPRIVPRTRGPAPCTTPPAGL